MNAASVRFLSSQVPDPHPKLRDDRGVPIASLTYEQLQDDREGILLFHRVTNAAAATNGQGPRLLLLYVPLYAIFAAGFFFAPRLLLGVPPWLIGAALGLVLVICIGVIHAWLRKRESGSLIATFLAHSRCPACAYKLAAIPPDAQAMVLCPECGASWNASRIGTASAGDAPVPPGPRRFFTPVITDDHHRVLELTPLSFRVADNRLSPERAALARRVVLEATILRRIAACVVAFVLIVLMSFAAYSARSTPLTLVGSFLAIGIWSFWLVQNIRGRTPRGARAARKALLDLHVCPACATDLKGQPSEFDQTVRCPNCAAHWRLSAKSPIC